MSQTVTQPKTSQKGRVADALLQGGITPKQAEFVKGMADGKTPTQAALAAYNTNDLNTAHVIANENLQKPTIKEAMAKAFDNVGLTPETIAKVLQDASMATKTATINGEVLPSHEPDHGIRVTAVRTAATIMGLGKEDGQGGSGVTFNFNTGTQNFIKQAPENS